MLIGFMAARLINACSVGHGTIRFCRPLHRFLPILDSFSAIVRRTSPGGHLFDRSHLHHRFRPMWAKLDSVDHTGSSFPFDRRYLGTLCDRADHTDLIPLGAALSVLVFLIVTKYSGRNEWLMLRLNDSSPNLFAHCEAKPN